MAHFWKSCDKSSDDNFVKQLEDDRKLMGGIALKHRAGESRVTI
jgi:hypothetical protein